MVSACASRPRAAGRLLPAGAAKAGQSSASSGKKIKGLAFLPVFIASGVGRGLKAKSFIFTLMIPRSHRLRTREVAEVLKRGRGTVSGAHLSAKVFFPDEGVGGTIRSAAVVSKKVARTAVARNRVRRAVYDALRGVTNTKAAHIVFFVRSVPKDNLRSAFSADIVRILSSLKTNN